MRNRLILVAIFAISGIGGYYLLKNPLSTSGSCTDQKIVLVDLEGSDYSATNIDLLKIKVDQPGVKHLEYNSVVYKGGLDAIYELDAASRTEVRTDKNLQTGWIKTSGNSFAPKFPPGFEKEFFLGVYLRAQCQDGSISDLTRVVIDRHLSGNHLYAATANNPIQSKYFK